MNVIMKKSKKFMLLGTLALAMLFSMSSCSVAVEVDKVITIDLDFDDFRNWELVATVSENRPKNLVDQNEPSPAQPATNRNSRESKVYNSINNSESVEWTTTFAFRLALAPKQGLNLSFMSFQHETIFTEDDAPPSYNNQKLVIVHTWHLPTVATLLKKYRSLLTAISS